MLSSSPLAQTLNIYIYIYIDQWWHGMVGLVVVVMVEVDFGLWVWVLGVVANGSLGFGWSG